MSPVLLLPDDDGVITISFLLIPEYAMVSLLSAIEPLRVSNRISGQQLFRWQVLSEDGNSVEASNGMALQEHSAIHSIPLPRNLFINSSFRPERQLTHEMKRFLINLDHNGSIIGALDTGCYLVADANLLKKRTITMHWEAIPAFKETYSYNSISDELFEVDSGLLTCAGGTAATDMMLYIIQQHFGNELAMQVCEQFIKSGVRQKSDNQRLSIAARLEVYNNRLIRVISLMEDNLSSLLTIEALAQQAHISIRQMERLFRHHLNCTPTEYYLKLRLKRASYLLLESGMTVTDIAQACAFKSSSHFCRSFRNLFSLTPSEFRRTRPGFD